MVEGITITNPNDIQSGNNTLYALPLRGTSHTLISQSPSTIAQMYTSKTLSLPPPPFPHDHRIQRLYSDTARSQPSGQCHFRVLHAASTEQRCPCQGYQQNRSAAGTVCDCNHAACYHAHSTQSESLISHSTSTTNTNQISSLSDKIRKLEEAVHMERDMRESELARERQCWEREIRVLKEALAPFYRSEEDMQQRLTDIEDKLDDIVRDQAQINAKIASIEDAGSTPGHRVQSVTTNRSPTVQGNKTSQTGLHPNEASRLYSGSDTRTSVSAEPFSPRQSTTIPAEHESPRSSGILNMVELPRPALPRHVLPPRMSPPAEADEPRSSGFLALDIKELISRRRLANNLPPAQAYGSPSNSSTRSPPNTGGRTTTPQSLPRISPPTVQHNGYAKENEERAYKKRKHQGDLMALDVLADVSAASPVMS